MAYVNGKLGETIQELMDERNIEYDNGDYIKSIDLLIEAWDKLPDDKVQYDESYLIIWGILDIAIKIGNIDIMNQWVDKIFIADPGRGDTGEREMWAGRVAYESNDMDKAKMYFEITNQKSKGRCFGDNDKKYKKLLL